jgi:Glycosyl hydrolases family 16
MRTKFHKILVSALVFLILGCIVYLVVPETVSSHVFPGFKLKYVNDVSICLFIIAISTFILSFLVPTRKVLFFNLGFLIFIFCLTEEYSNSKNNSLITNKVSNTMPFVRSSDTLGWDNIKNAITKTSAYHDTLLLYDVKYTLNENGQRITPEVIPNDSMRSVLFFGCSFTFGQGIRDNETMAYMVQDSVRDKYKVYNFGVIGFGANQMLSAIEHNMIDGIVKYPPKYIIFNAIPDHIGRIYSPHTPRYLFKGIDAKEPVLTGLNDYTNERNKHFFYKILNSEFYKYISKKSRDRKNIDLYTAIILKSKNQLFKKYPNSHFHVIYWDSEADKEYNDYIIKSLKEKNITTHIVSDILPGYNSKSYRAYVINFSYELHPNSYANQEVSNYILKNILSLKPSEYFKVTEKPLTDEFSSLNRSFWQFNTFNFPENGCSMLESQVECKKSNLLIKIDNNNQNKEKKFRGGGIFSSKFYRYGAFSITLKNNIAPGTIFSLDLLNKWQLLYWERKEIGLLFLGSHPDQVVLNIKSFNDDGKKLHDYYQIHNLGFNSSKAFHTYTIVWTKDSISLVVDNKWACSDKGIKLGEEMNITLSHWMASQDNKNMTDWLGPIEKSKLPSVADIDNFSYKPLTAK